MFHVEQFYMLYTVNSLIFYMLYMLYMANSLILCILCMLYMAIVF